MEESDFADDIASFIPYYPSIKDSQFSYDIARKKEFQDVKLPPVEEVPKEQGIPLLSQELQSRFFSPHTDFTSGLLFHGMGTGKCGLPDTIISSSKGEITIKDLWDKYSDGSYFDGEGEWAIPETEILVSSFDKDKNKIILNSVHNLYRQKISEEVVYITLDDGSKINITKAHHLFNGDQWTNKFKEGDVVCIPETIPRSFESNWVTPELARWMGWQISEGYECPENGTLDIPQKDRSILDRLISDFGNICKDFDIPVIAKVHEYKCPRLRLYRIEWRRFLEEKGYQWGKKSAGKDIPDFIFGSSDECVKKFLRAYFEGDGSVDKRQGTITVASASWKLISKISTLLRRFGIWLRIRKTLKGATNRKNIKRVYYEGMIPQEYSWLYAEKIGFESERKQSLIRKSQNTNIVTIPCQDILVKIREKTNIPYRKFIGHPYIYGNQSPSRKMLEETIERLKICQHYDKIIQEVKELELRLERPLLYPKIKNIKIEHYKGYVYDLEVQHTHNYIANNILCHNTCTSALIVENFKSTLVDGNQREPAIVIVPNAKIARTYRTEVMTRCTREGIYIPQKNPTELRKEKMGGPIKMTEMTLERRLKAAVEKTYRIVTLETFLFRKHSIKDSEGNIIETRDEKRISRDPNLVRKIYSNRVIIIDEAHKIRETSKKKGETSREGEMKEKQYEEMHRFLHAIEGCRIILLTGTPIWDQVHEIASLMNLILPKHEQLPTGKAFMREFFNSKKELDSEKSKLLRTRFRGRVSFLRQMVTIANKNELGVKKPWLKYITVYPSGMSDFQYKYAKKSRSEVKTISITYKSKTGENVVSSRNIKGGALSMTARDASTFVFPVFSEDKKTVVGGSYGNTAFSKNVQKIYGGRSYKYINSETEKAVRDDLEKYSSKFASILKEIKEHPNELIFIYDEFIVGGGGSVNLALILKAHGFLWARGIQDIRKPDSRERKRFAVITSDTATIRDDKHVAKFLESFNKPDNKYGERCQIIIGSETIGMGITIKNVRQIHIVTPHWTIPAIDQAISRAIRVGSHQSLPEDERQIKVYRHISVKEYEKGVDKIEYDKGQGFPKSVGFSSEETMDTHIYSIAEEKDYFNSQIYRLLKEISWDCPLTYERNVLKNDKDGSRACDYVKCNYVCDGFPEKYINKNKKVWGYDIPPDEILKNTYNIFYSNVEINEMVKRVVELFGVYFSLRFDMVGELISIESEEENKLLLVSLDYLINHRIKIKNRYGFGNYLKEDGNIYFLDTTISVFSNYPDCIYSAYPFVRERTSLEELSEIFQLREDKKLVKKFCHEPRKNVKLLNEMHYRTLIILLEKIQELRVKPPKELTPRENEAIGVIMKHLGRYLITLKGGIVVHNMYTSEYTGVGYSVAVQEFKSTGSLRVFDPSTRKWYLTSERREEELLSQLKNLQKTKNENVWEGNEYGIYGFIDKSNKLKIRTKPKPGQRDTRGSVCIEGGWDIPKLYQLFCDIGEFPPASKKFDNFSRSQLIKDIKSQPSLGVFCGKIEDRSDKELREILTLYTMDKKQMCKELEEWLKSKDLFYDYRV